MEKTQSLENRIIGIARQLFMEKGYHKTNMSDIAVAAGINRPTLHYYFRTKDKMFQAVFGSLVSSFLPRIQLIFCEETPFMEKIEKVVDEYLRIFSENPFLPRFILEEARRDMPHLMQTIQALQFENYIEEVLGVIKQEMESGNIRTVPIPVLFVTFYSQLVFPFLSQSLIVSLFYEGKEDFASFLVEWKKSFLSQMHCLLDT